MCHNNNNKGQSDFAKSEIANSLFMFTKWQHSLAAICNCMFWLMVQPPKLPFLSIFSPLRGQNSSN